MLNALLIRLYVHTELITDNTITFTWNQLTMKYPTKELMSSVIIVQFPLISSFNLKSIQMIKVKKNSNFIEINPKKEKKNAFPIKSQSARGDLKAWYTRNKFKLLWEWWAHS